MMRNGSLAHAAVLPRWRIPQKGRLFVKAGGAPFPELGDTEWPPLQCTLHARQFSSRWGLTSTSWLAATNGPGTVEEGAFTNGRRGPGRCLAGGETIPEQTVSLCNKGTRRVTLYQYR